MPRSHRTNLLLRLLSLGRRRPEPARQPASGAAEVDMPIADAERYSGLAAANARARAAARRVDTLRVASAELRLRVGEVVPRSFLRIEARDATGAPVEDFAPTYVLRSPVAAFDGRGVVGRAPGTAVLYIEALPGAPPGGEPRPRPSAAVRITVVP
ncbi:hypothetical protein [Roseisolibacter sp. H3M3-2]|uniref:hypothetical protein n=1 Tax=Roseisolibacter sp. H3M3-2 TaxID=3031323 RepID=UPI0023DA0176|nr:hypothetical protein [Roseisolibacter sp. H3M3-2]MDF1501815.1 hypothetical protein [Roseisolibacter sp. H3M3-2]